LAIADKIGTVFQHPGGYSSRRIHRELSGLQDEVAAEEFGKVKLLIESEFSCLIHEVFPFIEEKALASASLDKCIAASLPVVK
jgi:hypothetical protein